jgi:hypothetical protein
VTDSPAAGTSMALPPGWTEGDGIGEGLGTVGVTVTVGVLAGDGVIVCDGPLQPTASNTSTSQWHQHARRPIFHFRCRAIIPLPLPVSRHQITLARHLQHAVPFRQTETEGNAR